MGGERDRDEHALAHAARELVRELVVALGGPVDADLVEQLDHARPVLLPRQHPVDAEDLRHLGADPRRRVERGRRVLGDETDLAAPDRPQVALGEAEKVPAVEQDLARRAPRGTGEGADDCVGERALPGARLPHHRDGGPGGHVEGDGADRVDVPGAAGIGDGQVADRERRGGCRSGPLRPFRGRRTLVDGPVRRQVDGGHRTPPTAESSQREIRFVDSTTAAITALGSTVIHQAVAR